MTEEKGFFEKVADAVKDFKIGGIPGNTIDKFNIGGIPGNTIDKFEVCGIPGLTIDKAIRNLGETGSVMVSAEKDDAEK